VVDGEEDEPTEGDGVLCAVLEEDEPGDVTDGVCTAVEPGEHGEPLACSTCPGAHEPDEDPVDKLFGEVWLCASDGD